MGIRVKRMMAAGFAVWLLFVGGVYALHQRQIMPTLVIPFTPSPNPNARTFFLAAMDATQDSKAIDAAIANDEPTKNGVPLPPKSYATDEEKHIYTLAEKAALVRKNQAALAKLRQGFGYAFGNPPARSFSTGLPELAKFRTLARLLVLYAQVKRANGDWNGAVSSV